MQTTPARYYIVSLWNPLLPNVSSILQNAETEILEVCEVIGTAAEIRNLLEAEQKDAIYRLSYVRDYWNPGWKKFWETPKATENKEYFLIPTVADFVPPSVWERDQFGYSPKTAILPIVEKDFAALPKTLKMDIIRVLTITQANENKTIIKRFPQRLGAYQQRTSTNAEEAPAPDAVTDAGKTVKVKPKKRRSLPAGFTFIGYGKKAMTDEHIFRICSLIKKHIGKIEHIAIPIKDVWEPHVGELGKNASTRFENAVIEYKGVKYRILCRPDNRDKWGQEIYVRLEYAPDGKSRTPQFSHFIG